MGVLQEQQMAELNGNLPMLSSLAQSGSTRAGSDLARAFYSSHAQAIGTDADPGIIGSVLATSNQNDLPVITSSRDVLPTVVTEPNEAGYSVASALASDLPGLQERARISELAQEARIGKTGTAGDDGRGLASKIALDDGATVLARMHNIVSHGANPNKPAQVANAKHGSFQQSYSDQGNSAAAIAGSSNSPKDTVGTNNGEDGSDKAMAAAHYAILSGPAKMPRWPVMPKLASSDHFGAPRKIFDTGAADEEGLRAQLQAASVAGLAGAATRRLHQAAAA